MGVGGCGGRWDGLEGERRVWRRTVWRQGRADAPRGICRPGRGRNRGGTGGLRKRRTGAVEGPWGFRQRLGGIFGRGGRAGGFGAEALGGGRAWRRRGGGAGPGRRRESFERWDRRSEGRRGRLWWTRMAGPWAGRRGGAAVWGRPSRNFVICWKRRFSGAWLRRGNPAGGRFPPGWMAGMLPPWDAPPGGAWNRRNGSAEAAKLFRRTWGRMG